MQQSVAKPFSAEQSVGGPAQWEFLVERLLGRAYTLTLVRVNEVQLSRSIAKLEFSGAAGDTVPAGSVALDDEGNEWATAQASKIGDGLVTAVCGTPGAIAADPNTITMLARPIPGVAAVTNPQAAEPGGATGPVGFLSATDLTQQMDGNNQGIPNVPMEGIPYFRYQGGANAVILDPKPGDIGLCAFARRDISQLKDSKQEGPPPSLRQMDVSDGLYIGGFLNGAPQQWIQFLDSGINIRATAAITIDATLLQVNCPIISTGDITDHTSSMQTMRDQYNAHEGHTLPGGAPPNVPME